MNRFAPQAFALLRILSGVLFALHGTQKLLAWPGDKPAATAPLMIAAGWIELVCGVLIAAGLLTTWAAFLASGTMAVVYFKSHALGNSFFPIVNRGELAVVYCFLFLYFAAHGPGIWSLDRRFRRR
jgi:putative oxidoreductase